MAGRHRPGIDLGDGGAAGLGRLPTQMAGRPRPSEAAPGADRSDRVLPVGLAVAPEVGEAVPCQEGGHSVGPPRGPRAEARTVDRRRSIPSRCLRSDRPGPRRGGLSVRAGGLFRSDAGGVAHADCSGNAEGGGRQAGPGGAIEVFPQAAGEVGRFCDTAGVAPAGGRPQRREDRRSGEGPARPLGSGRPAAAGPDRAADADRGAVRSDVPDQRRREHRHAGSRAGRGGRGAELPGRLQSRRAGPQVGRAGARLPDQGGGPAYFRQGAAGRPRTPRFARAPEGSGEVRSGEARADADRHRQDPDRPHARQESAAAGGLEVPGQQAGAGRAG